MDMPAISTPTQLFLAWALFGILLCWLVIFAALALRPGPAKRVEWDDLPPPSVSFPDSPPIYRTEFIEVSQPKSTQVSGQPANGHDRWTKEAQRIDTRSASEASAMGARERNRAGQAPPLRSSRLQGLTPAGVHTTSSYHDTTSADASRDSSLL